MTDKEWIAQIKIVSNKELLNALENCGYDSYYSDIYNAVLDELERRLNELTDMEIYLISKVFQNYYCMGINGIAEEDETARSLFEKIGLIERKE